VAEIADPPVGVVIATRDRRASLLRTLGRLEGLPEQPPVVVVDNASSDHTAEAVGADHPAVEVVRLPANAGASARTLGARLLRTPLIAFSDDDSWWAPGALARASALFAAHPRLGLLAARILVGPGERLDPTCAEMARSPLPLDPDAPGTPVLGFLACGAIVRRSAFLEVRGFQGRHVGGEEHLVALDLAAAGWALSYVEDVVAHHHPPGTPHRDRRRRELESAYVSTWLRRRTGRALAHTFSLLRQRDTRRDRWSAFGSALGQAPSLIRDRRPLPRRVERSLGLLPGPGLRG
jgi:GT2 family glycosyltransferase